MEKIAFIEGIQEYVSTGQTKSSLKWAQGQSIKLESNSSLSFHIKKPSIGENSNHARVNFQRNRVSRCRDGKSHIYKHILIPCIQISHIYDKWLGQEVRKNIPTARRAKHFFQKIYEHPLCGRQYSVFCNSE